AMGIQIAATHFHTYNHRWIFSERLSFMVRFFKLWLGTLVRLLRSRQSLLLEKPGITPTAWRVEAAPSAAEPWYPRQAFLDSRSASLGRLEAVPDHRHPGNRDPLAPSWVSS